MFFACGLVLLIFILPALAISWVIPAEELSLTAGVMQAFDAFFAYFDLQVLVPIVAIALVCASAGGMLTWLSGPSKGLLLIARREGYLPPFFQQQNENEVAVNILVVQGAVTTVIALLYALVPSVSSAYWILSVMTTQVYLIVYVLMFIAAVQPAPRPARRGARLPRAGADVHVRRRVRWPRRRRSSSASCRRRSSRAAATLAYVGLILAGTVAARPAAAVAVPEVPQARLEDGRGRRTVETRPSPPPRSPRGTSEVRVRRGHRWLLWVVGGVVVVLLVVGLVTYSGEKETEGAQQKAQELTQKLEQAGLRVPQDQDIIVRSLGTTAGPSARTRPTRSARRS